MGFFPSRKAEPERGPVIDDQKPIVRIIRSRFYGKQRGKADENTSQPRPSVDTYNQSLRERKHSFASADAGTTERPPSSMRAIANHDQQPAARPFTDAVTMTLAQRLNELAAANAEGLLDDDEYRLLRQNLFERLAGASSVPTEAPIVKLSSSSSPSGRASNSGRPASQYQVNASRAPSIQSRTSVSSTVSGLLRRATGRRSASVPTNASTDSLSVFSQTSRASNVFSSRTFPRSLSRKGSESSLRTDGSLAQFDAQSAMSGKTGGSAGETVASGTSGKTGNASASLSRSATRSTRRLPKGAPPSSFPARITEEPRRSLAISGSGDGISEYDHLETSEDLRREIELVEAEGRRLLDAFSGLELSALTRRDRRPGYVPPLTASSVTTTPGRYGDGSSSEAGSPPPLPTLKCSRSGKDSDVMSIVSSTSVGTSFSAPRPAKASMHVAGMPPILQPVTLTPKTSFSSMSSRGYRRQGSNLSISSSGGLGRLSGASSSAVSLARSTGHLPLASVAEGGAEDQADIVIGPRPSLSRGPSSDANSVVGEPNSHAKSASSQSHDNDVDLAALEKEMADIRRRRAEVTARYDARLEYLRAKLKGAEIREKLRKK